MEKIRHKAKSRARRKKSTGSKRQKPLKIDVSSLLNHHKLIQKSIPHLQNNHHGNIINSQPDIQMLNFQSRSSSANASASASASASGGTSASTSKSGKGDNNNVKHVQDWYILVASTPYAISAQLLSIPKSSNGEIPDIVVPDFIQCTPISVWTSSARNDSTDQQNRDTTSTSAVTQTQTQTKPQPQPQPQIEALHCKPRILTYEPPPTSSSQEYLQVAILCGLESNRLLSVQLSIYAYVGMQGCEGRFVLSKSQSEGKILEPLLVDTEKDVRRKLILMEQQQQQQQQQQSSKKSRKRKSDSSEYYPQHGNNTAEARDDAHKTYVPYVPGSERTVTRKQSQASVKLVSILDSHAIPQELHSGTTIHVVYSCDGQQQLRTECLFFVFRFFVFSFFRCLLLFVYMVPPLRRH